MLTISDTANVKIKEMVATQSVERPLFLRVSVKEGGCSGFSYGMGLDDERQEDDQLLEIDGLQVVVDPDSSRFLYGVEIGYKETAMGGGFTIHNPNAVATCGCGSSFRTQTEAGNPGEC